MIKAFSGNLRKTLCLWKTLFEIHASTMFTAIIQQVLKINNHPKLYVLRSSFLNTTWNLQSAAAVRFTIWCLNSEQIQLPISLQHQGYELHVSWFSPQCQHLRSARVFSLITDSTVFQLCTSTITSSFCSKELTMRWGKKQRWNSNRVNDLTISKTGNLISSS